MGAYTYKAQNDAGKLVKGVIEGDSERQVRAQLRSKQLKPVEVLATRQKIPTRKKRLAFFSPSLKVADISLLTRQMATLVQSHMPLDEVLTATAEQANKPRIQAMMLQVRARVLEGHSLAYALGDYPQVFSKMYRAMVAAGEKAGFLGLVLERLADYVESRHQAQQKLKMAMVYPLILVLVSVVVISLLMVLVVPELVGLFVKSGQALPALTQMLISSSEFVQHYGLAVLLAVVVLIAGLKRLLRKPVLQQYWHRVKLRLPIWGAFILSAETARFSSTLSILISSGVPLLESLRIIKQVVANVCLQEACERIATAVQEGASLSYALNQESLFPPLLVHMVSSGEASGELEAMLARSAQNQERELDMALTTLMGVLEPLMVVVMAGIVGLIVVAILLPVIEMNNLIA